MTTEAWIKVLAVLVAAWPVGLLVNVLVGRLFKLRERIGLSLISKFTARALRRAISLLAAGLFIYSFYPVMELSPKVDKYLFFGIHTLTLAGVLLLAAALWESVCDHLAERKGKDERSNVVLVTLTRKLGRGVIFASGLLLALASYGVNVMGVLTGLGLSGLIVALAAKDSVENIFGSLTILLDMPFSLGEWIKVGNIEGVVEEINLRSTRLRTFEDSVITLPNANLIKAAVENYGARRVRRQKLFVRLAYDGQVSKLEKTLDAIRKKLAAFPEVQKDRVIVELNDLGEGSLGVLMQCFLTVEDLKQEMHVRGRIISLILSSFKGAGLDFAPAPHPVVEVGDAPNTVNNPGEESAADMQPKPNPE